MNTIPKHLLTHNRHKGQKEWLPSLNFHVTHWLYELKSSFGQTYTLKDINSFYDILDIKFITFPSKLCALDKFFFVCAAQYISQIIDPYRHNMKIITPWYRKDTHLCGVLSCYEHTIGIETIHLYGKFVFAGSLIIYKDERFMLSEGEDH